MIRRSPSPARTRRALHPRSSPCRPCTRRALQQAAASWRRRRRRCCTTCMCTGWRMACWLAMWRVGSGALGMPAALQFYAARHIRAGVCISHESHGSCSPLPPAPAPAGSAMGQWCTQRACFRQRRAAAAAARGAATPLCSSLPWRGGRQRWMRCGPLAPCVFKSAWQLLGWCARTRAAWPTLLRLRSAGAHPREALGGAAVGAAGGRRGPPAAWRARSGPAAACACHGAARCDPPCCSSPKRCSWRSGAASGSGGGATSSAQRLPTLCSECRRRHERRGAAGLL